MTTVKVFHTKSWDDLNVAIDGLGFRWMYFRGQSDDTWPLQTSFEREFGTTGAPSDIERGLVWRFARHAPRLLPPNLLPLSDGMADRWLGLIQHYGGPTRFLDVTLSPFVALFFAMEPPGPQARALWVINGAWCQEECARIGAEAEGIERQAALDRLWTEQAEIVASLVHLKPVKRESFSTFKPFAGVFPVDPWKPDYRQVAQQAQFLCAADLERTFMANLEALDASAPAIPGTVFKVVVPSELRDEFLGRLAMMNVTASNLFPDLAGLARSLRTLPRRRNPSMPD